MNRLRKALTIDLREKAYHARHTCKDPEVMSTIRDIVHISDALVDGLNEVAEAQHDQLPKGL